MLNLWNPGQPAHLFIGAACCLPAGFAAGIFTVKLFNVLPAAWLCDYGETPGPALLGRRVSFKKHGLVTGALYSVIFFLIYLQYPASAATCCLLCCSAIPIMVAALSDIKYQIIPDQCLPVILILAAVNLGFDRIGGGAVFYDTVYSPFLGAALGGLIWILIGGIGRFVYKKESVGFGDVKLFSAIGFLCGFPLVVFVFVFSVFIAGLHFSLLILMKKLDKNHYMPMGPYLCAACLLAIAFRSQVFSFALWYLGLFQ